MCDGPLLLQVNWTIVDTVYSKGNKLVAGVKIKASVESKLNNSSDLVAHAKRC